MVDAVTAELNSPNLISTVQAVEKFTKDKSDEQAKASVVNTYRKQQSGLLRLLDALPDWTADGDVWLEKVTADNNTNKVTLEGGSVGSMAFARFYGRLENQPLVKGLKMPDKSTTKGVRNWMINDFKLEFSLEAPR
jgi:hypothetical protein